MAERPGEPMPLQWVDPIHHRLSLWWNVQGIVRKERKVEPRIGGHHLIPLREHVDAGCRVGHDFRNEPSLEG